MAVAAEKIRGPLAGPGGPGARPWVQLAVRCIPAHRYIYPEELHPGPLLLDATCVLNHEG